MILFTGYYKTIAMQEEVDNLNQINSREDYDIYLNDNLYFIRYYLIKCVN